MASRGGWREVPRGSWEEGTKHTSVAGGHTQGLGGSARLHPRLSCVWDLPAAASAQRLSAALSMGLKTDAGQGASLQVLWERGQG